MELVKANPDDLKPYDRVIVKYLVEACTITDYPDEHSSKNLGETEVIFLGFVYGDKYEAMVQVVDTKLDHWRTTVDNLVVLRQHNPGATYDDLLLIGKPGWYVNTNAIFRRVVPVVTAIKVEDDGMCCNLCKNFSPMACSNMPNGEFRCFSCRQDPWRASF